MHPGGPIENLRYVQKLLKLIDLHFSRFGIYRFISSGKMKLLVF